MIGSKLAHYEILALLGEGGMGQVYRARDTKLGREVAIKVLPPAMAHDPDRRMRFDREARAVAALRHPHIVTIHSVEEDQGTVFLTMELVEGQTLSELIPRDGMTLDRFFSVAVPLVDAVASAHQKGITHRDLKPANVMIGTDKQLKVLDFGLAKHFETVSAEQETQAQGATGEGRILGTAAYMSPEQAEGKPIDLRSDIFSLGVLLFEMATGARPFKGDTNISTITSILRDDPPSVTQLKQNLPRHLGRIIKRCLAKDPDRRYQTSLDLKNDLIELKEEIASGEVQVPATSGTNLGTGPMATAGPSTGGFSSHGNSSTSVSSAGSSQANRSTVDGGAPPRSSRNLALLIGAIAVLAVAVFASLKMLPRSSAPAASSAPPARAMRITRLTDTGKSVEAAISPDGRVVAHVKRDNGAASLWITQISTASNVEILPPSTMGIWDPIFDRAGEFIYFLGQNRDSEIPALYRIPSLGGTPRKILDRVAQTIALSPDGKRFAFLRMDPASSKSMIFIANIDGSAERLLATKEAPEFFTENPSWSPDGTLIAAPVQSNRNSIEGFVVTFSPEGGQERRLSTRSWLGVSEIAWYPDGSGLVVQANEGFGGGQLWEIAFPSGVERRITNDMESYEGVSLTADGRVLAVGLDDANFTLQTIDIAGSEEPQAVTTGKNRRDGGTVAWTPDGRIVYDGIDAGGPGVWIVGTGGAGAQRLFQLPSGAASVSPDGRFLTYLALQNGVNVWKSNLDGTNPTQLTKEVGEPGDPHWSGDGRWIVYRGGVEGQLYKISADGGEPMLVSPKKGVHSVIVSPDGTRIAFRAWDPTAEKTKTYVISFADGKTIATLDHEFQNHQWSPDGRSLVYSYEDNGVVNLWSRPIDGGPARQLTRFKEGLISGFAFSRDGKRIAMGRGQVSSDVVLITDFR